MIVSSADSLRDYLAQYAMERGLAPSSVRALTYVLNSFEKYLQRPANLIDLTAGHVNAWLAWLFNEGLDPETVRGRRTAILAIWRDACEAGLVCSAPARIRKIKVPDKPPRCWDLPELGMILAVTRSLSGRMNKDKRISRADFWTAYTLVDYESGYRLGDLRKLSFDKIARDGTVVIVQNKTRLALTSHLSPDTMKALNLIRGSGRKLVFGDLVNHSNTQRYFRKIVREAGLTGSTKWLRRSGATWCEVESPGSAMAYLGHKTPGLAHKNYIDRRFVQRQKPRPPRIS